MAPNPDRATPRKAAPKPQNWAGVTEGLTEAMRLLRHGQKAEAEQAARAILEFAPHEPKGWHLLGRILQMQEQHGEALECFDRAAALYRHRDERRAAPEAAASPRLARLLWQQGDLDGALAMIAELLHENPEDMRLYALADEIDRALAEGQ